jgi:hypothetical protein
VYANRAGLALSPREAEDGVMRGLLTAAAVLPAAACLWGAVAVPVPALVPLVWLGAFWLPGAWLAVPARTARWDRPHLLLAPLAYGPVLFGTGMCVGRLAGIPLAATAASVVCLGSVALLVRVARMTPYAAAPGPRLHLLPLIAGLVVFVLGVLPPFTHPPLRFWGDALLHLPVMRRTLDGGFPPENPFLAGMPLGYFWFYHAALAPVARLGTLSLDWIPALMNGQGLLVLLWAVNRAGRAFGLSPLARAAALLLLGTGLTPWGWMRLLVMQATHPEINWPLVRVWGISALLPILSPVDPRLAGALTKIAVSNALPMSLGLAALAAVPPEPGRWAAARRTVLVAGCLGFHLAVGLLLAAGLGLRWLAGRLALRRRLPPTEGPAPGGPRSELLPLAIGLLVTAPYVLLVLRAREGSLVTPGWHGGHALGLHLALAGMWILSMPALGAWWRRADLRGWLWIGVPALVLPFVVHLVDGNEYKSIFFLLVLLSPVAGAGLERLVRGKAWLAGAVLLLFLPTTLLVARGLRAEIPRGYLTPAERRDVGAMGAELPPDAVLWAPDPDPGYSPLTLPLGRPSFVSDTYALRIMGQWQGREVRWRRASLALAGTPGGLPRALSAARARVGGRPLAVVVTPAAAARYPFLEDSLAGLGFRPRSRHPLLVLYTAAAPDSATPRFSP